MLTAARRGRRQDHRSRGRRRRLPHEAVQPARARRPRQVDPPPRDPGAPTAGERAASARRSEDRRGAARGPRRRGGDPARAEGVRPPLGAARPQRASCSRATSCSSACGATRCRRYAHGGRARPPAAAQAGRTRRRSSRSGAWGTRSRPAGTPPDRTATGAAARTSGRLQTGALRRPQSRPYCGYARSCVLASHRFSPAGGTTATPASVPPPTLKHVPVVALPAPRAPRGDRAHGPDRDRARAAPVPGLRARTVRAGAPARGPSG